MNKQNYAMGWVLNSHMKKNKAGEAIKKDGIGTEMGGLFYTELPGKC